MQEHRPRKRHKGRRRPEVGNLPARLGKEGVQFPQGKFGPLDVLQREIGKGVNQAGGQPRPMSELVRYGSAAFAAASGWPLK